jgi:hypothetical protein
MRRRASLLPSIALLDITDGDSLLSAPNRAKFAKKQLQSSGKAID